MATTAYYVVSEAITNVVKHAAADRIALHIDRADGRLRDQGARTTAAAAPHCRTGSTIADRVAALGGTLRVHSPLGAGTVLEAVLPCAS